IVGFGSDVVRIAGETNFRVLVLVHEGNEPVQDCGAFRLNGAFIKVEENIIQQNRPFHLRCWRRWRWWWRRFWLCRWGRGGGRGGGRWRGRRRGVWRLGQIVAQQTTYYGTLCGGGGAPYCHTVLAIGQGRSASADTATDNRARRRASQGCLLPVVHVGAATYQQRKRGQRKKIIFLHHSSIPPTKETRFRR